MNPFLHNRVKMRPRQPPSTDERSDKTTLTGSNSITVNGFLGDLLKDPKEMNRIRQDVQAWFMAYIPGWESSFTQTTLAESIVIYEALDEFFSQKIDSGIDRKKGGKVHV